MDWARKIYHQLWALGSAVWYRFPSRQLKVVAITGTKGKTTTAELVNAILEEAGFKTALAGTLRFKIGSDSKPNLLKMSMPGRGFLQRFLRQAVVAGCDWVIIEMTSEGTKQYRQKFIALDALIFTNISPEHIESHGSYENYLAAKLKIAEALASSPKPNKVIVANGEDKETPKFLAAAGDAQKITYTLADFSTLNIEPKLPGEFNKYNILAAATFAKTQDINADTIKRAIEKVAQVRGRVEEVSIGSAQKFKVIVDYAHTADSLEKLYQAFPNQTKICVLGGTGGGRDTWKRAVMGGIADKYCDQIFLTDEDPYDEDPKQIVSQVAEGIKNKPYKIIMDRREAIREAIKLATLRQAQGPTNQVILISGKGTDPFIMGPHGTKTPWDDATVAREELAKVLN